MGIKRSSGPASALVQRAWGRSAPGAAMGIKWSSDPASALVHRARRRFTPCGAARAGSEAGQVTLLAALLVGLAALLMVLLAALGEKAVARARAQTAADAVALAAVSSQPGAAEAVAAANGASATVVRQGSMARADAEVDGERAAAQAEAGEVVLEGIIPAMAAALARAEQLLGMDIVVVSGWRSRAAQERLWAQRFSNPYPVAVPGTSMHERGMAVDVPSSQAAFVARVAVEVGLCQPLPRTDPIHFTWCAAAAGG